MPVSSLSKSLLILILLYYKSSPWLCHKYIWSLLHRMRTLVWHNNIFLGGSYCLNIILVLTKKVQYSPQTTQSQCILLLLWSFPHLAELIFMVFVIYTSLKKLIIQCFVTFCMCHLDFWKPVLLYKCECFFPSYLDFDLQEQLAWQ